MSNVGAEGSVVLCCLTLYSASVQMPKPMQTPPPPRFQLLAHEYGYYCVNKWKRVLTDKEGGSSNSKKEGSIYRTLVVSIELNSA